MSRHCDSTLRISKAFFGRAAICAAAILLLSAGTAISLEVPQMGSREEGSMTTSYKEGGKRWTAKWTSVRSTEDGVPIVTLTLSGEGLTSPFSRDMKWESVAVWKADGSFTPLHEETVTKDAGGKTVMKVNKSYDAETGTVIFKRDDLEGDDSVDKRFETGSGFFIVEGLVLALRALPFGTGETVKTTFLTNEPDLYNVEFKQKGIETISTPEGELECYKVELVPKLGLLGVFKTFFPKTYFWFTVDQPYRWVRYAGYENGLNTPEVVMESDSFKTSQD